MLFEDVEMSGVKLSRCAGGLLSTRIGFEI
jgi:hypothetical protein